MPWNMWSTLGFRRPSQWVFITIIWDLHFLISTVPTATRSFACALILKAVIAMERIIVLQYYHWVMGEYEGSICYGGCGSLLCCEPCSCLKMCFYFWLLHFPFFQNEFHFSLIMLSDWLAALSLASSPMLMEHAHTWSLSTHIHI